MLVGREMVGREGMGREMGWGGDGEQGSQAFANRFTLLVHY